MSLVGFKPTIPASDRPQTRPLDRSANGTGCILYVLDVIAGCNYRHRVCNYWPTNNIHAQPVVYLSRVSVRNPVVYLSRVSVRNFMFLPEKSPLIRLKAK